MGASYPPRPVGVLLAGGLSRRMGGGDKGLKVLGGRPVLDHVVARARPQVDRLILNAAGDPARFAAYGLPVVPDVVEGFAGPLAGVLTGLEWAAANVPGARHVVTFACDAPFLPTDLVDRLLAGARAAGAPLACARSRGRTHPVFGLWSLDLAADLRHALVDEDLRKIVRWTARHGIVHVDFDDLDRATGRDPFFNINRPEDLAEAEALATGG